MGLKRADVAMLMDAMDGFKRSQYQTLEHNTNQQRYQEQRDESIRRQLVNDQMAKDHLTLAQNEDARAAKRLALQEAQIKRAEWDRIMQKWKENIDRFTPKDPTVAVTQEAPTGKYQFNVPYSQMEKFGLQRTASDSQSGLGITTLEDAMREELRNKHGAFQQQYIKQAKDVGKFNARDLFSWVPGIANDQQQVDKIGSKMKGIEEELTRMMPPKKIASKEEFEALPSGSKFIDPDGIQRIKP